MLYLTKKFREECFKYITKVGIRYNYRDEKEKEYIETESKRELYFRLGEIIKENSNKILHFKFLKKEDTFTDFNPIYFPLRNNDDDTKHKVMEILIYEFEVTDISTID